MPWTDPAAHVFGVNETVTNGTLNTYVKDNLLYLHDSLPTCRAYTAVTQSIANNTRTAVAFELERFDTDTIHSTTTNTSRLTCNTAGVYLITGQVEWPSGAGGTARAAEIRLNGATFICMAALPPTASTPLRIPLSTTWKMAANDYVELTVYQDSGGAVNLTVTASAAPEFAMTRIAGG